MSVRIPAGVNRVLDTVASPPHAPVTAASSILAAAAVGLVWVSQVASAVVAGLLAAVLLFVMHYRRVSALRERAEQAESDLRIARHEIAQFEAGDPSAPTAQYRAIGDGGEPT